MVKETQGDSDLLDLTQLELAYTTIIYSQQINDQGQPEWVEYQRLQSPEENRSWKPLNEISPYIQHAFVAVEDENFYTHPGFSLSLIHIYHAGTYNFPRLCACGAREVLLGGDSS